jgi:SIR2-like domain
VGAARFASRLQRSKRPVAPCGYIGAIVTTVVPVDESPAPGHTSEPDCQCVICRVQRPFGLPDRIVSAAINCELVIFAGAGTSTENPLTLPTTLYSSVVGELGYSQDDELPPFPQAMTEYEDRHGRPALLQKAKERFDYIDAFHDLRFMATRFHQELSTLFMINTIVTTNWDTYFETQCGATPIVTEDDYAFWNLPGRKVFKVHGSMNNLGSIIATTGDYERCYAQLREGVIGSTLKHMLATKTTLFLGYSFRDDDFNQIYELVRDQLGPMLPRPVIVTLDDSFDLAEYPGAEVVVTDATYFFSELKRAIVSRPIASCPTNASMESSNWRCWHAESTCACMTA